MVCRALANITNAGSKAQTGQSAPKDIPGAAKKHKQQAAQAAAQQQAREVAAPDTSKPLSEAASPVAPQPASFGSPERLMGMAGADIDALEEKEERARIEAHAEQLVANLRAGMNDTVSSMSPASLPDIALPSDDERPLSPLPDISTTSADLPDLPDWFFPLEFELE